MKNKLSWFLFPCLILIGFMASQFTKQTLSPQIKREISHVKVFDETNISPMAYEFTKSLKRIKSVADIDLFIKNQYQKIEAKRSKNQLSQLPSDYRLLASFIYPIVNLRGILYRIFGLVKKGKQKKYSRKIIKTIINSKLQSLASIINLYCPSVGNTIFDWLTEPAAGITRDLEYIHQIQDFIITNIYGNLQKSLQVISSIKELSLSNPITIDSSILTGDKNVLPKNKRYFNVREHELIALKQYIHSYSHGMILYAQYNRDDIINFEYAKKKKLGNPLHIFSSKIRGFSMYDSVKELRKWKNLYTFRTIKQERPAQHKTWLLAAYDHAKKHIALGPLFLEEIQKVAPLLSENQAALSIINPKSQVLLTKRLLSAVKLKTDLILNHESSLRNNITGAMIISNYPMFYTAPSMDLKKFLPLKNGFKLNTKKELFKGKIINYRYGQPTNWDISYWNKYFPSIKTDQDVKKVAQTIKSTSLANNMIFNILIRFVSISSSQKLFLPYSL